MFDLLFTLPGQAYPFPAWVRVHWDDGTTTITRVVDREPVEQVMPATVAMRAAGTHR